MIVTQSRRKAPRLGFTLLSRIGSPRVSDLVYSDELGGPKVAAALEMVKGFDPTIDALGLPGRLLALSSIFGVETISAGLPAALPRGRARRLF